MAPPPVLPLECTWCCWRLRRAASFVAREAAAGGDDDVCAAILAFQPAGANAEPTDDRRMAVGLRDGGDSDA